MNGIQVILLAGIGLIGIIFLSKTRSKGFYTALLLIAALVSVLFILWPDITNKIAHALGVGRGADLIFYISILVFCFILIQLFARIRKLEQMMTELIRKDAIDHATGPAIDEQNPT